MIPIDPNISGLEYRIYAKDQPQYRQLPSRVDSEGAVITCWKMSLRERLLALFRGQIFLTVLTFHKPLQPVRLEVTAPEVQ